TDLVTPFTDKAKFTTDDGIQSVATDDIVEVRNGHTGGGDVGNWYKYKGTLGNPATINLSTEDFSNEGNWESLGSPAGYKAKTFVGNLTGHLKDDLGFSDSTTTWVDATATGDTEVAVAGAVGINVLTRNIQARIDDGAKINQNIAYRG